MKNRVLINKSDTMTDISTNTNNYHTGTNVVYLTVGDYLYIGQRSPFNHMYFNVSSVNEETSVLSAHLWDGDTWQAVAEIIDETEGFIQSGYITWTPDKDNGWALDDSEDVTGLTTTKIYDLYWVRIGTDVDFTNTTALSWIGNLFCSEEEFFAEHSNFKRSSYLTAWETGKTTWEEQRVTASSMVSDDLISKNIINDSGQIIERHQLRDSTVTKTSMLVFDNLGDDYVDDLEKATKKYYTRINKDIFRVDKNKDGRLDQVENTIRQGKLTR